MSIIEIDNVSMRFNLSKERHESFKEYFLALAKGHLQSTFGWSPAIFTA